MGVLAARTVAVLDEFREYDIPTPEALRVLDYLRDANLIEDDRSSLTKLVRAVRDYAQRLREAESVEGGLQSIPTRES